MKPLKKGNVIKKCNGKPPYKMCEIFKECGWTVLNTTEFMRYDALLTYYVNELREHYLKKNILIIPKCYYFDKCLSASSIAFKKIEDAVEFKITYL